MVGLEQGRRHDLDGEPLADRERTATAGEQGRHRLSRCLSSELVAPVDTDDGVEVGRRLGAQPVIQSVRAPQPVALAGGA